jgi:hypothetical protein
MSIESTFANPEHLETSEGQRLLAQTHRILAQNRTRYADPKRDAKARIASSKILIKDLATLLTRCADFDRSLSVAYEQDFDTLRILRERPSDSLDDDDAPALRLNPVTGDLYVQQRVGRQIPGLVFDGEAWRSTIPDSQVAPTPGALLPMTPVYLVVLAALLDAMPVREERRSSKPRTESSVE